MASGINWHQIYRTPSGRLDQAIAHSWNVGFEKAKESAMASPDVTRLMLELAGAMQRLLAELATLPRAYQLPMLGAVQKLNAIHIELLEALLQPGDED